MKAEHLSNAIEEDAYDKKVPPKRNGNYDRARRSKNELDQWQTEIKHRKSCAQGNKGKREQEEQKNTREQGNWRNKKKNRSRKKGEEGNGKEREHREQGEKWIKDNKGERRSKDN